MLVLVSFGLVLLATILLVVGLLTDDGLNLIYLSIASSIAAAVVLYLAFRRARPTKDHATEPPAPLLPELADDETVPEAPPTRVEAAAPAVEVEPIPEPTPEPEPATAGGSEAWTTDDDWASDDDWADAGEFAVEFPIADYDELSVAEIMPLLPQLYSDELEVVAQRERAGKNRATILARLDELAATGTEADATGLDEADDVDQAPARADQTTVLPVAGAVAPEPTRAAPPPRPAAERAPVPTPAVPSLSDDEDDDLPFPIADYDELTADQIMPLLAQLEDDELEDVKAREAAGQARKSVITEIDRQLGLVDASSTPAPVARPEPAPTSTPAPTPAPAAEATPVEPRPEPEAASPDGALLAIAGYDGLTVSQIRPLLAGLSPHELQAVLEHESARDNRRTIIADIERRLGSAGAQTPAAAPAAAARATSSTRAAKKATATKKAAKRPVKKASSNHRFPIEGYEQLTVSQIRPRLAALSAAQLQQVRERELQGAGRKTILTEIDRRLG